MATYTVDEYISFLCPALAADMNSDMYVGIAEELCSEAFFGDKLNYAIALRACHNYTMDKTRPSGESGTVTQRTEGKVSVSFASAGNTTFLSATTYGERYKELMRSMGPFALTSGGEGSGL